jgi:two-component system chemotaxis response regulator CheB
MSVRPVIVAIPERRLRAHLTEQIASLQDFTVIATANDLMQTFTEVEQNERSVVLIAQSLAAQPEFEVMRGLFTALDIRWLVLSDGSGAALAPSRERSDLFALSADAAALQLGAHLRSLTHSRIVPSKPASPTAKPSTGGRNGDGLILLGASTGGVDALLAVLGAFDAHCPPVLLVQHTGAGFGESLAGLLDRQCRAKVVLVDREMQLERGTVYVGAGMKSHLILRNGHPLRCALQAGEDVCGHTPSVDVLFRSAIPVARRVAAALLTGMGRDGGTALRALRDAGAATIAQDQASSVVFGMPRAAIEAGGAADILPLNEIGPRLLDRVTRMSARERTV